MNNGNQFKWTKWTNTWRRKSCVVLFFMQTTEKVHFLNNENRISHWIEETLCLLPQILIYLHLLKRLTIISSTWCFVRMPYVIRNIRRSNSYRCSSGLSLGDYFHWDKLKLSICIQLMSKSQQNSSRYVQKQLESRTTPRRKSTNILFCWPRMLFENLLTWLPFEPEFF